jgi:probable addiction module antidote protein
MSTLLDLPKLRKRIDGYVQARNGETTPIVRPPCAAATSPPPNEAAIERYWRLQVPHEPLIGGDKSSQDENIARAKALARELLKAALEEGDPALVAAALGDIARAKGMTALARDTGLARESLYKALSPPGNPELATIMRVVEALGLKLHVSTTN